MSIAHEVLRRAKSLTENTLNEATMVTRNDLKNVKVVGDDDDPFKGVKVKGSYISRSDLSMVDWKEDADRVFKKMKSKNDAAYVEVDPGFGDYTLLFYLDKDGNIKGSKPQLKLKAD